MKNSSSKSAINNHIKMKQPSCYSESYNSWIRCVLVAL